MRTTIEKVRVAVLAGAALLAVIVMGFLGYAHYRTHRVLQHLPARLGADIQKETNGITYSQSVKGRTVFTMHAAKATQHKDGRTGLEDVGIVLYGPKDGRADRISGKQFDYDQKAGVVRALGEVQLDLQAPAPTTASARAEYARGGRPPADPRAAPTEAQPIHVVTSGLRYSQGEGVATTDQPIRFEYRGMTGQARGATYDSGTGVTTLESEVRLAALRDGRPTVLTAAHAELHRTEHRMMLRGARYVVLPRGESDRGAAESIAAGSLVVHLGVEGQIEGAEGTDGVEVATGESRMRAPAGALKTDADGRPQTARMTGGVVFASEGLRGGEGDAMHGRAATGMAHFDGHGAIETVRLTGEVQATAEGPAGTREMSGNAMDLQLAGENGGSRRWVRQATLRGAARVASALPAVTGHTAGEEEMRGDTLVGTWQERSGVAVLHEMTGEGHTELRRRRDGIEEDSRSDRLQAMFGPVAVNAAKRGKHEGITTATQQGHVAMDKVVSRKGHTERTRATAESATYDAGADQVTLAGGAELADEQSAMRAQRVVLRESTGDAEATGAVQLSYRRSVTNAGAAPGGNGGDADAHEPVHVTGARAVLQKADGVATVFGGGGARARLWQEGSQVEAPVLVFGREQQTLDAYGTTGDGAMPVHTVLANRAAESKARNVAIEGKAVAGKARVLRVASGRLHYVESLRRAEFREGVLLEDANGTITSRTAVATLAAPLKKETAANESGALASGGLMGGGLERVTAAGGVAVRQPGRLATGQQAVYTVADGLFVLTGGEGALPTVVDEVNGSVSGATLRFRSGDNSVTVDGRTKDGMPETGDGRVHTRTRVKQ